MKITGTKQEKQLIVDMCDVVLKAGGLKNMSAVQEVLKSIEAENEQCDTVSNLGESKKKIEGGK